MNTIIKIFLVLCCNTQNDGVFTYEVKDLQNTNSFGTILTERKYQEGDTVKMFIKQPIVQVVK